MLGKWCLELACHLQTDGIISQEIIAQPKQEHL